VNTTIQRGARPVPDEAPLEPSAVPTSLRDPRYQAFWMLRLAFTAIPLTMGIDKFFNGLVYWPKYLADWIDNIAPGTAQQFMYFVGVVEIVAGIVVAVAPRFGGYLVAAWLLGIIVDLVSLGSYYDVALRDFGLFVAALALARLATSRVATGSASATKPGTGR